MDTPPTTPLADDDEAEFDTYVQQFGPTFINEDGDQYRVTVMSSDCTNDRCHRCYEPIMLSIDLVGSEPHEPVQIDIRNDWDQVDKLIAALTAAREQHR